MKRPILFCRPLPYPFHINESDELKAKTINVLLITLMLIQMYIVFIHVDDRLIDLDEVFSQIDGVFIHLDEAFIYMNKMFIHVDEAIIHVNKVFIHVDEENIHVDKILIHVIKVFTHAEHDWRLSLGNVHKKNNEGTRSF